MVNSELSIASALNTVCVVDYTRHISDFGTSAFLPIEVFFAARTGRTAPFGLHERRADASTAPRVFQDLATSLHLPDAAGLAARAPGRPLADAAVPRGP